jgi:hypothetical protein
MNHQGTKTPRMDDAARAMDCVKQAPTAENVRSAMAVVIGSMGRTLAEFGLKLDKSEVAHRRDTEAQRNPRLEKVNLILNERGSRSARANGVSAAPTKAPHGSGVGSERVRSDGTFCAPAPTGLSIANLKSQIANSSASLCLGGETVHNGGGRGTSLPPPVSDRLGVRELQSPDLCPETRTIPSSWTPRFRSSASHPVAVITSQRPL